MFCAPRFDREALAPLLRKAKSVGAMTIADMVPDQRGYGLGDLKEVWPLLDYATPSDLEAELLTGLNEPKDIAAKFMDQGVKNVILKRAVQGVIAFLGDRTASCPAFDVKAADTTGAGDNFVAGFIHALIRHAPAENALRFGSATAALSIQAVGAGAGLKDLDQVERLLQDHARPQ